MSEKGVVSQYIDDAGKCRGFTYKNLTVLFPPRAPLHYNVDNNIKRCSLKEAEEYMKENNMTIYSCNVYENNITGIWGISKELPYCYIAIKPTKYQNQYSQSDMAPPINEHDSSIFEDYLKKKRIAHVLSQYTLYGYSLYGDDFSIKVESSDLSFDDIQGGSIFSKKCKIFNKKTLYVPNEDIKIRLEQFLKLSLSNNTKKVLELKDEITVPGFYNSILDYTQLETQYIFNDAESIRAYKAIAKNRYNPNTIYDRILAFSYEPYFYKSGDNIYIVQGASSKEKAVRIGYFWLKSKTNIAHKIDSLEEEKEENKFKEFYNVYERDGICTNYDSKKYINILHHVSGKTEKWCALLLLNL